MTNTSESDLPFDFSGGERNTLQYYLGRLAWWQVILTVFGLYLVLIIVAVFLYSGAVATDTGKPVRSVLSLVYFSGVTQSTVGFGDIRPITDLAQITALAQAIAGPFVLAIGTALIIASLLLPNANSLQIAGRLVFNPVFHRFELLFVSTNRGTVTKLEAGIFWILNGIGVPSLDALSLPYRLEARHPVTLMTPPIPAGLSSNGRALPDDSIRPQPSDVDFGLTIELSFLTPARTRVVRWAEFPREAIVCGTRDGEHVLRRTDMSARGQTFCRDRCMFGPSCRLTNKVQD